MLNKHNTFGKGSHSRSVNGGNDAYYTDPEYATYCCKIIKSKFYRFRIDNIVEPSAGNGSFHEGIKLLCEGKNRFFSMYDVDPKQIYINKKDFFDVIIKDNSLVIGNPPFGFSASLAIRFFNYAAKQKTKLIAFILPKTFKKDSVKNKLNLNYRLVYEENCPKDVFLLDGKKYNVPCVFQVWIYTNKKREIEYWSTDNRWIEYTTLEKATFCLRRVGGRSGQVLEGDLSKYSKASTYFCNEKVKGVKEVLRNMDFDEVINSTAGVKSLSKREIHKLLYEHYSKREGIRAS